MSRNGSGTYTPPTNSWNPAVNGVSATAVDWQSILNDLSAALTQSVSRDGQSPMTGNLSLSGNKLTGLGAGTGTGDSLRFEQLFDQGVEQDVASAATTDIGTINSNFVRITGTTSITSFGTNYKGPRFVRFGGILTLTHNATTLILPTGANITTAVGDRAIVTPIGNSASGWQVLAYQRADGTSLVGILTATNTIIGRVTAGTGAVESLSGAQAQTILPIGQTRTDVASAATVDLTTLVPGNSHINITGTTTITAFTVTSGRLFFVRFNAALTLTNNASIITQTGANIVTQAGDTCILRATAANTVEVLSYSALSDIRLSAAAATTSGTAIDFTGIPSWARRVTLHFNGVSVSGTANPLIQLGDAGGPETTGYLCSGGIFTTGSNNVVNSTSGFIFPSGAAANVIHGKAVFDLMDASTNTWVCTATFGLSNTGATGTIGGTKSLSPGPLTQIRLTTTATDTFDAGSASISWE